MNKWKKAALLLLAGAAAMWFGFQLAPGIFDEKVQDAADAQNRMIQERLEHRPDDSEDLAPAPAAPGVE